MVNQPNVAITHTKLSGYKCLLFLCLAIINCSCSRNNEFFSRTLLEKGMYTVIKNDSLKIKMQYFGDYVLDNKHSFFTLPLKWNLYNILHKNKFRFLTSLKSTEYPKFKSSLYVNDFILKSNHEANKKYKSFYKGKIIKEKKAKTINILTESNKKNILIINKSIRMNDQNVDQEELARSMNDEFTQIIKNSSFDTIDSASKIIEPFDLAEKMFFDKLRFDYSASIKVLEENSNLYLTSSTYGDSYLQLLATYYSFVHDKSKVDSILNKRVYTKDSQIDLNTFQLSTGVEALKKSLFYKKIVLFNESHYEPNHRLLLSLLLPYMYSIGFRHLALESISEDFNEKNVIPTLNSGFYTREYQMANLIRHATQIGFNVISYDNDEENRDFNQAKEIYKKTIFKQKDAKVIALAGHSHINKNFNGRRWMASYLQEMTNEIPYTVNQERFSNLNNINVLQNKLNLITPISYDPTGDVFLCNKIIFPEIVYLGENRTYSEVIIDLSNKDKNSLKGIQVFFDTELKLTEKAVPCYTNFCLQENTLRIIMPVGKYIADYVYDGYIKRETFEVSSKVSEPSPSIRLDSDQ